MAVIQTGFKPDWAVDRASATQDASRRPYVAACWLSTSRALAVRSIWCSLSRQIKPLSMSDPEGPGKIDVALANFDQRSSLGLLVVPVSCRRHDEVIRRMAKVERQFGVRQAAPISAAGT